MPGAQGAGGHLYPGTSPVSGQMSMKEEMSGGNLQESLHLQVTVPTRSARAIPAPQCGVTSVRPSFVLTRSSSYRSLR